MLLLFASGTTTNTFGQPAAQGASTGFGFGQTGQQAQPQAAQQPSTGFGFGAQSTTAAPQTGGLFGSQPQQQNQQSGGLFGAKPAGGLFGSTTGTTNTFGAPAQTQGQTGGGLFGAAQPAQPAGQQPSGGLFGNTGTNTFGAAKPGGLFGQPAQTGTTGGGLFGNNSTNTTTGFGQPAAQPSTGLFGSTNQQTGGGLFGNLGASQQGQQNQTGQTGGLFGAKPNNAGSGLFGQTNTGSTLGASTGGSGLFGNSFGGGAQQQNQQNMGGSLFGNSSTNQLQQSQAQPPVNIDVNNPYGTGGMFSVPPSFQPINVSTGPKVLPPLSSSLRPAPSAGKMTPRFRGISTPARAASTLPTGSILGVSTASNGSPARNLFSTPPPDTLSPAAFTPRQGVKKLVLHRKTDSLSLSTAVANRTPQISRSILNPEADHDGTSVNGSVMGNTVAGSRQASVARTQNDDAVTEKEHRRTDFSRKIDLEDYNDGDYYTIPEMSELYNASNEDLSSVEDFVVGRKGYGRLTYLEPVDIGNKTTLNRICGDLVTFRDGKCEVYPEKADERPPGEGLNHRAEISLEDCWPRNKETQQPITDPKHPKQRARERALRHVPDTTFQSYNPSTGVWVFTVEHFTLYGIPEEDDSDDEEDEMDAQEDSVLNENGKRERSAGSERYGSYNGDEAAGSPSEIDRSSVAPSHADDDASEYARSSVQPVEIAVRQRDLIFTGMYGTPQPDDLDMTPRPNKKRLQFFRKAEKDLDGEVDGGDVDVSGLVWDR
jgi:nuclear pore complex protein Nup98-Nup96